ncbi:MAG TPA: GNAT family N-acetyltransferase [Candidatus Aminicenantes bacterium]|nr:GNAT family N-acetyltransferase [Candidatus Aminicenantes bacterium]HRY64879.1 GNAT family N-acetyltransferase [Candidatus Aminicenantes bacterium]HRZ71792.1 GNAT family N-acetyltransferase [Candidatus Aminicenantes bacterium]
MNPLEHPGWDSLVLRAGDPGFFHSAAWARILQASYGFKPSYVAALDRDRLEMVLPLMEVPGLFGARRGVSLPFTDYCPPLGDQALAGEAVRFAIDHGGRAGWRSIEWRDAAGFDAGTPASETYYGHDIDLRGTDEELLGRLHEGHRRNIRRAEREGVSIEFSGSLEALRGFCRLNGRTRKRHGLPPQPFAFFAGIYEHALCRDLGFVVSARRSGRLLAAAVFFHFGGQALFKFGASDPASFPFRPNNLIIWEAMRRCRDMGLRSLSLGRTEPDNPGLLRFKRGWGARERVLRYYKYDLRKRAFLARGPISRKRGWQTKLFSRLPDGILRVIGRLAYRYVG